MGLRTPARNSPVLQPAWIPLFADLGSIGGALFPTSLPLLKNHLLSRRLPAAPTDRSEAPNCSFVLRRTKSMFSQGNSSEAPRSPGVSCLESPVVWLSYVDFQGARAS